MFLAVSLACCGSSMASIDEIRRNAAETSYGDTTREQVLETRNRRKKQLKVIVMDAQRKLADHSAGVKILTEEEKTQLENNVDLFQRKIESMEVELEEWVGLRGAHVGKFFLSCHLNFPMFYCFD